MIQIEQESLLMQQTLLIANCFGGVFAMATTVPQQDTALLQQRITLLPPEFGLPRLATFCGLSTMNSKQGLLMAT